MFHQPCAWPPFFLEGRAAEYYPAAGKTFPGRKHETGNKGHDMNKMAKGALAIGLGSALLLGGGGTLAVWNAEASSQAGTIAAGELGLTADNAVWTNDAGQKIDISSYRMVPGETITYTQDLNVKLAGDRMQAKVSLDTANLFGSGNFNRSDLEIALPTLTKLDGAQVPQILTPDTVKDLGGKVRATAKVKFIASGVSSSGATGSFGAVKYKLEQQAPTSPAAVAPVTGK